MEKVMHPSPAESLQRLSLIGVFRELDVAEYLFGDVPSCRSAADKFIRHLQCVGLIKWDGDGNRVGYKLDPIVRETLLMVARQNPNTARQYRDDWESSVDALVKIYPRVSKAGYLARFNIDEK